MMKWHKPLTIRPFEVIICLCYTISQKACQIKKCSHCRVLSWALPQISGNYCLQNGILATWFEIGTPAGAGSRFPVYHKRRHLIDRWFCNGSNEVSVGAWVFIIQQLHFHSALGNVSYSLI